MCECGCEIRTDCLIRHLLTEKHHKLLNKMKK